MCKKFCEFPPWAQSVLMSLLKITWVMFSDRKWSWQGPSHYYRLYFLLRPFTSSSQNAISTMIDDAYWLELYSLIILHILFLNKIEWYLVWHITNRSLFLWFSILDIIREVLLKCLLKIVEILQYSTTVEQLKWFWVLKLFCAR